MRQSKVMLRQSADRLLDFNDPLMTNQEYFQQLLAVYDALPQADQDAMYRLINYLAERGKYTDLTSEQISALYLAAEKVQ